MNEVSNMLKLSGILGGSVGLLPTMYLAMPLGSKSKAMNNWNSVIEKREKKLTR